MDEKLQLSPPWQTYAHEVKALFDGDPQVKVIFDQNELVLKLFVENPAKADALGRILPAEKDFGNVKVQLQVIPADNGKEESFASDVKTAFEGNRGLEYIRDCVTPFGEMHYVVLTPRIVQFYNDDMSDVNGNRTMILQDVARDVIGNRNGVYFCTAGMPVNGF